MEETFQSNSHCMLSVSAQNCLELSKEPLEPVDRGMKLKVHSATRLTFLNSTSETTGMTSIQMTALRKKAPPTMRFCALHGKALKK